MITIIINADDYGIDENRTKAIAKCLCDGTVTNTTLMVNMPYAEQAVALAKQHGFMDRIGLHVNLIEGLPLTQAIRSLPDFCDENGYFLGPVHERSFYKFKKQFVPFGPKKRRIIAEEVTAQFERFLSFGFKPGHFDSHNYVHCNLDLIPIIFPIAKRFGFTTSRRSRTIARFRHGFSKIILAMQYRRMQQFGLRQTKHFGSFVDVKRELNGLQHGDSVEMMVHPMYLKDGEMDLNGEMFDSIYCPMQDVVDFVRNAAKVDARLVSYPEFSRLVI